MPGADGENRAREIPEHVGQRPRGLARPAHRVVQRQIEDDLVGVAVSGRGRPRPPAVAHPPERIPGQQEHPQSRSDPRVALSQCRPGEPQLQQRALALRGGEERVAHIFGESGVGFHDAAQDREGARG